jgi:hypothetical protein
MPDEIAALKDDRDSSSSAVAQLAVKGPGLRKARGERSATTERIGAFSSVPFGVWDHLVVSDVIESTRS